MRNVCACVCGCVCAEMRERIYLLLALTRPGQKSAGSQKEDNEKEIRKMI